MTYTPLWERIPPRRSEVSRVLPPGLETDRRERTRPAVGQRGVGLARGSDRDDGPVRG